VPTYAAVPPPQYSQAPPQNTTGIHSAYGRPISEQQHAGNAPIGQRIYNPQNPGEAPLLNNPGNQDMALQNDELLSNFENI
jgi:hypothetical protein